MGHSNHSVQLRKVLKGIGRGAWCCNFEHCQSFVGNKLSLLARKQESGFILFFFTKKLNFPPLLFQFDYTAKAEVKIPP